MTIRITDLPQETPKDGSSVIGVVEGKASLIPTNEFLKKDETVSSASSLKDKDGNVILPEELLQKTETAIDSEKLGGVEAKQYATKKDLETATGKVVNYTWACPFPWFMTDQMPDLLSPDNGSIFAPCDGRELSKADYPELAELLCFSDGTSRFPDIDGNQPKDITANFFLPNLCGKVIMGANLGTTPAEELFSGESLSVSSKVGSQGGNYVQRLEKESQIPYHRHKISQNENIQNVMATKSTTATRFEEASSSDVGGYAPSGEVNYLFISETGGVGSDPTSGFSIIPHHTTFCYIMRLKP